MKLQNKLMISQALVFVLLFIVFTMMLSHIVYRSVSKSDCEKAMNLNEQIMMGIDQHFEELERFTNVVAEDEALNQFIESYMEEPSEAMAAKIRLYLSNLRIRNKVQSYGVIGILVNIGQSGTGMYFTTVGLSDHIQEHILEEMRQKESGEGGGSFINPFRYSGNSATMWGNHFNMAYGYNLPCKISGQTGSIAVIASFDPIIYTAENMETYSNDYLLLNKENEAVEPSVIHSGIRVEAVLENLIYGETYQEGYYRERDAITTARFSEYGNWKILCRLTKDDILKNNQSLILLDEILVAVFGICVILLMIPLVRRFIRPLAEVSGQMEKIARGNLEARVVVFSRDEIGEVGKSFNIMAEKLQENINKMIAQEKREQKMRYSLMISQVDPHFIYNTMNTITYLAQKGRNEDVIAVNKAMIEILKDRLRIEMEDVYDTVEQEIKVVEQYLLIQSYRYRDTFKTELAIGEDTQSCYIAKNILQPLVENALFHGLLCNRDEEGEVIGGCIRIQAQRLENYVVISVKDNGIGMSEEMLEELENQRVTKIRGEHIGIRNIKGRIRYIYGDSCSFTIQSKEGEGTVVVLKFPMVSL